jgi:type I restriction enzyme S subunit
MGSEWHVGRFGDLFAVPPRNGIHKGPEFQGRGVPVVKMGEVYHTDVIGDALRDLYDLAPDELRRLEVRSGDLLFCRTSLVPDGVGHCAMVGPLSTRTAFASNLIRVRLDPAKGSPRYWYYFFRSRVGHELLLTLARGTSVTTITGPDIAALEVDIPDLREQHRVAGLLGALDDKIELNRRMSQTLESMARALFKSWFVDFDPVRAKAEGRDTRLPGHLEAMFPNSLNHSDLGEVPMGWPTKTVGDLSRRIAMGPFGSDITVDNFVDSGVPVVRGMNLKAGFLDDEFAFVTMAKADALRNANAFPGDIVITHRGTLGQVGLIPEMSRYPRYVVSQSQMLLSSDRELARPAYLYQYLRSPIGQHALLASASQTGVPAIARPTTSLRAIRVLAPPIDLQSEFERLVDLWISRVNRLGSERLALIDARDTLLPRLLDRGVAQTRVGTPMDDTRLLGLRASGGAA